MARKKQTEKKKKVPPDPNPQNSSKLKRTCSKTKNAKKKKQETTKRKSSNEKAPANCKATKKREYLQDALEKANGVISGNTPKGRNTKSNPKGNVRTDSEPLKAANLNQTDDEHFASQSSSQIESTPTNSEKSSYNLRSSKKRFSSNIEKKTDSDVKSSKRPLSDDEEVKEPKQKFMRGKSPDKEKVNVQDVQYANIPGSSTNGKSKSRSDSNEEAKDGIDKETKIELEQEAKDGLDTETKVEWEKDGLDKETKIELEKEAKGGFDKETKIESEKEANVGLDTETNVELGENDVSIEETEPSTSSKSCSDQVPKTRSKKRSQTSESQPFKDNETISKIQDSIKITFEVLLHEKMNCPDSKVFILFGPPLSDWTVLLVSMKQKPGTEKLKDFTYLTGDLVLPVDLKSKTIPYKYAIEMSSYEIVWEAFLQSPKNLKISRCLLVPHNVEKSFVKFDDVILAEPDHDLQLRGREAAIHWMLPSPAELEDPEFDFQMSWQRFQDVVQSFGVKGTKICKDDIANGFFNTEGFSLKETIKAYAEDVYNCFETNLHYDSVTILLQKMIFVLHLLNSKHLEISRFDDFQTVFKAFYRCKEVLFDKSKFPKSITNQEVQSVHVKTLKLLVKAFTSITLGYSSWDNPPNTGDWIYAIPFIHHWDKSGDQDWLNLDKWKRQMKSRFFSERVYLEYVSEMKLVDEKIEHVFTSMLEQEEIERILANSSDILILTPSQILTMLKLIDQPSKLSRIQPNLVHRFRIEMNKFKTKTIDGQLSEEDSNQIQIWSILMTNLLSENVLTKRLKFALVKLFLDIILACSPTWSNETLVEELSQYIRGVSFSFRDDLQEFCQDWSIFMEKFTLLNSSLHGELQNHFKSCLKNVDPEKCMSLLLTGEETISTDISDLLFDHSVQLFQSNDSLASKAISLSKHFLGFDKNNLRTKRLTELFEKCLNDVKLRDKDYLVLIKTVVGTPAISNMMKFYPKLLELRAIAESSVKKANFILESVYNFCQAINEGSAVLSAFEIVDDEQVQNRIILICQTIEKVRSLPNISQTFQNNVKLRLMELDAFNQAQTDVNNFINRVSSSGNCDKQSLDSLLIRPNRASTLLQSVCNVRVDDKEKIELRLVHIYGLSLVRKHNDLFAKSSIFRQIQEQHMNAPVKTWKDLLALATSTTKKFNDFVMRLFIESITNEEVIIKFKDIYTKKQLDKELAILADASNLIGSTKEVLSKIKLLFNLRHHRTAIRTINQASKNLGRKENIHIDSWNMQVMMVPEEAFLKSSLDSIKDDMHRGQFIDWKDEHIDVLESLNKSQNLLKWIKENIRDRADLKTFYELASISAGESDHEVDRVLHFYQAVSAYAPLILDLEINSCNFKMFLEACNKVFEALERDPKIAVKLIESSNRNLEWIKACKEQQGSVEQSSLSLVNKINESGFFIISVPDRSFQKSLDNFVKLRYTKIQEETEFLALEDLQELRSKLMLITAGTQSKNVVERFVRILSLVELVCKHLMALLQAGCYLFSQWKLSISCDPNSTVKVTSDLGHRSGGLLHGVNDVENELNQITSFLMKTHEEWSNHIYELRKTHHSLNFYTTDQLNTLSFQLVNLTNNQTNLQLREEMLLRLINPTATRKELETTLRNKIPNNLGDQSKVNRSDRETNTSHYQPKHIDNDNPFFNLVSSKVYSTLSDDLFPRDLILASLIECGIDDLDSSTKWCCDHVDDPETIQKVLKSFTEKRKSSTDEPKLSDSFEKRSEFDEMESGLISEKLNEIFEQFLKCSDSHEIQDHLSFPTLGKCLDDLSANVMHMRKFPSTLKEGKPNLIVCSESEIYTTALSLYMEDPEKPLPSLDEVLICQADTPLEKIELICSRAFSDKSGKIYVIIHAERMSYDFGVNIENLVYKDTTVENHKYRLIFLASKEGNNQSYIVNAFEKDRRHVAALPKQKMIQDYLLKNLKTNDSQDDQRILVIKSKMSGNGKSLAANRVCAKLRRPKHIIQINDPTVNQDKIISAWFKAEQSRCAAFHLDLTPAVKYGKEDLIFSLSVLGGLEESGGQLWLNPKNQFIIVELTSLPTPCSLDKDAKGTIPFENFLPSIVCVSPSETLELLQKYPNFQNEFLREDPQESSIFLFDHIKFQSSIFQRPYMYLKILRNHGEHADQSRVVYKPNSAKLCDLQDCLKTHLRSCSIRNPTWMELTHFVSFLDTQLSSCEKSHFCNPDLVKKAFPGMKTFVVKFLIQMSKDFATRSVEVSDQSHGEGFSKPHIEDRHRWENSPHPYIFFNEDGHSISFFGFKLDGQRNLIDERSALILEPNIMTLALYHGLLSNGVQFNKSFDDKNEASKIAELCQVLGVDSTLQNPDQTYELTSDNGMKMLAIFMRFRSNIPVVIMGETGSGKTRLVKYLCDLLREGKNLVNLLILKTHGGITEEAIFEIVNKAIEQARHNKRRGVKLTVLFFDEANTTNAIGAIKSVMCDRLCNGVPIPEDVGLQFVAAVNPFREHSPQMIKKLENAGLGYHIKADKTQDKLGKIPMRRLVYRVKEIPSSMFPLIWDFGKLDSETEKKYITQMVRTCIQNGTVRIPRGINIVKVLSRSQNFMRTREDECSFVSLRDVERFLLTLKWFHRLSNIIAKQVYQRLHFKDAQIDEDLMRINIILALGVTYYTRLDDKRSEFEDKMTKIVCITKSYFSKVIIACQDLFVDELKLEQNIAKNDALKENVWMMAICIELLIPLFLVGKPGSSKSLAKTVVTDVMQGSMSYSRLFKNFKEIHMVSFQCSPLATASGILSTFRQCQKFQEKKDLRHFTAVAVLDEIGLAEDSEQMPLKALHPLLEDGCVDLETPEPHKKVSFVGISNWALDPAKMNRGILLSRGVPDIKNLVKSGEGICSSNKNAQRLLKGLIEKLANAYSTVYEQQERQYFGLRDFYSLIKMINAKVLESSVEPTESDIIYAVQRNFGGYFGNFKPAEVFLKTIYLDKKKFLPPKTLVTEAIKQEGETRYILLLTKNNAALNIIQEQNLLDMKTTSIIFGSSFIQDQEYRQICLNIKRIKIAMELGHTVILCNLNNLYESLYDALNQNYISMGDSRYVDLGLGTHRVKCRLHPNFRLVLIAEDVEVYEKFPIPLINRLEKHYLGMETMLTEETQVQCVKTLKKWLKDVSGVKLPLFLPEDVFIGYHQDAPASIILRLESGEKIEAETLLAKAKEILLECATPDAISRLSETTLSAEEKEWIEKTFYAIPKGSLVDAIKSYSKENHLMQVTTFSRLLTVGANVRICDELSIDCSAIQIITLTQINTEEQFSRRVKAFLEMSKKDPGNLKVLIIQAQIDYETPNNFVECSRYSIWNEFQSLSQEGDLPNFCIILLLQIPKVGGGFFAGFPGVQWKALHIDEIRGDSKFLDLAKWNDLTLYEALEKSNHLEELIEECIPKAAALAYRCDFLETARITRCVQIMKECFSKPVKSFAERVCSKVLNLIKRDEPNHEPKKWLAKLAMESAHLKEGNTFVKSIWLHLLDKVSKHLSDIIKVCDAYTGLEHLVCGSPWIPKLYIELMDSLQLDSFTGPNPSLSLKFPFSWAIENHLDQLYRMDMDNLAAFEAAFNATQVGRILLDMFGSQSHASSDFICDLVELTFGGEMSGNMKEYLCCKIEQLARRFRIEKYRTETDDNELNLSSVQISATDIYAAIGSLKPRLHVCLAIVKRFPEILNKMEENNDSFDGDIRAINHVLDSNDPTKINMMDKSVRLKWKRNVTVISTHLAQVESYIKRDRGSSEVRDLLTSALLKSKRAKIMGLFLDHVMDKDVDDRIKEVVCERLRLLWASLTDMDFVGSQTTFVGILHFIKVLSIKAEEKLSVISNCIQKCPICLGTIIDPVKLPCGHVGCKHCIENHFGLLVRLCPLKGCREMVPLDFKFESEVDIGKAVQIHNIFRQKLTQFFLDLLQVYIFQNGQPLPDKTIIRTLLSMIVCKTLPKDLVKHRSRRVSPFEGDFIDATPVVRSFVLQLLLRYSNDSVEKYLEEYLNENKLFGNEHFPELCIILIQCSEDSISNERSENGDYDQSLQKMQSRLTDLDKPTSLLKSLLYVAVDRIILKDVAHALNTCLSGKADKATLKDFMKTAIQFVDNHQLSSSLKNYLVRLIVFKYGDGFILDWKKQNLYLQLLPRELRISTSDEVQDLFLLMNPIYKETRDALRVAWVSGSYDALSAFTQQNRPNSLVWTMAINHLTHVDSFEIKNENSFETFLKKNTTIQQAWSMNRQNSALFQGKTRQQNSVRSLLIHFQEMINNKNRLSNFLVIFQHLALHPQTVLNTFLPTMPQDESLEIQRAVQDATKWYKCPNGHVYTIGDCGKPMVKGTCNICGSIIGGERHRFHGKKAQVAAFNDETKTGHILGKPNQDERSITVRDLSGLHVAILRFILHSAMLVGAKTHPNEILALCHPKPKGDPSQFLFEHMVINFTQIRDCLNKGENEVILLLHKILIGMREMRYLHRFWNLNEKSSVRLWEAEFANLVLKPVLLDLDNVIDRHNSAVQRDQAMSSNDLIKILHEPDGKDSSQTKLLELPQLWRPRDYISVENIESKIGTKNLKENCPFLFHLLQERNIFSELSKLPKLVELSRHLVKTFNRKFEVEEMNKLSLKQFLDNHLDAKYFDEHIQMFISVFNRLKDLIFQHNWEGNLVKGLLKDNDVSMSTPCSIIFPASQGFGLAATLLLRFLIEHHNLAINKFTTVPEGESRLNIQSQELLDVSMVVSVNPRDLHLLVVGNSEYSFGIEEENGKTKWFLNEISLEHQCIEKFLAGKPIIIPESIPQFKYRLEGLRVFNWNKLDSKIRQSSFLPSNTNLFQLESELPEICNISSLLDILQTTVDTILLIGGFDTDGLADTIYKLKIANRLPKSLGKFQLQHTQELMNHLRFIRAKRLIKNNQMPFLKTSEAFLEQLPKELMDSVDTLLHHVEPDCVAVELLNFIHERIEDNREAIEDTDKCLKDYFVAYLESKDSKLVPEIESYLSEGVKMKHCISLFKTVVLASVDRF